jgi:hypothetical protein
MRTDGAARLSGFATAFAGRGRGMPRGGVGAKVCPSARPWRGVLMLIAESEKADLS